MSRSLISSPARLSDRGSCKSRRLRRAALERAPARHPRISKKSASSRLFCSKEAHMRTRRMTLSLFGAIALSVVLAGQAFAADWDAPVTLQASLTSDKWAGPTDLVTSGSTAIAFFVEDDFDAPYSNLDLLARRSVDGGTTWGDPAIVSTDGADYLLDGAVAAGLGDAVD